jgi:dTDP-4-dehydrorhamnose 3,5-epimerase
MQITSLSIADVKLITPEKFGDARGFFSETYSRPAMHEAGLTMEFLQDNHSRSEKIGTLRGLHFQAPPFAQDKLVRVVRGRIFDVAVDIRKGSPTFGQHVSAELSASNWAQLLVPIGFAHGFVTLEPDTEVIYKVSSIYAPQVDAGVAWNDPSLAIPWPLLGGVATLSDKDQKLPRLTDIISPF